MYNQLIISCYYNFSTRIVTQSVSRGYIEFFFHLSVVSKSTNIANMVHIVLKETIPTQNSKSNKEQFLLRYFLKFARFCGSTPSSSKVSVFFCCYYTSLSMSIFSAIHACSLAEWNRVSIFNDMSDTIRFSLLVLCTAMCPLKTFVQHRKYWLILYNSYKILEELDVPSKPDHSNFRNYIWLFGAIAVYFFGFFSLGWALIYYGASLYMINCLFLGISFFYLDTFFVIHVYLSCNVAIRYRILGEYLRHVCIHTVDKQIYVELKKVGKMLKLHYKILDSTRCLYGSTIFFGMVFRVASIIDEIIFVVIYDSNDLITLSIMATGQIVSIIENINKSYRN